jgi:sigma-B regulation protein RsbU (phosphoserine phosphatase)
MSIRRIPFRYKLALSISCVVVGVLSGAFFLFKTLMERYVAAETERDLANTRRMVALLMEERRTHLGELAVALTGDSLTRTLLTDKTLNRLTRDDIVNSEILPNYPQLSLLAVFYMDGSVAAVSKGAEFLATEMSRHPAVQRSFEGRTALGFMRHETSFLQITANPVRIGPAYAREVIGSVTVAMVWSAADLKTIRDLSQAEIAFFDGAGVFLSSGRPFEAVTSAAAGTDSLWSRPEKIPDDRPALLPDGPERFIVVKVGKPDNISPGYMIARSLDRQLGFLSQMRRWLFELGAGGIVVGCAVGFVLALGISRPIHVLQSAFRRVAQGNFQQPAAVHSRDEFAELATAFNRMQAGLMERAQMKRALLMAEEVQRNLLPAASPRSKHLDIAGASIYCNDIGGDYYDFLDSPPSVSTVRIVLGDVCGHGTASALLMASSRALLRSRSVHPGPIEDLVGDVNRALALDMKETGRFLTLFLVEIDPERRELRWVRAGHEPAILFHPATETFENLSGPGLALGVESGWVYTAQVKNGLCDGQVILLGTDGLWEARNASGEMFGKDRLFSLLRRHARSSAETITRSVLEHLRGFQGSAEFEDDATLVVIKLVYDSPLPAKAS